MRVCLECENSLTVHLGFVHFSICTYNLLSFLKIITKRLEFLEFCLNSFSSGFTTNRLPNNFHSECGLWPRHTLWGRAFGATRPPQAVPVLSVLGQESHLVGAFTSDDSRARSPRLRRAQTPSRGDSATDCSQRRRRPAPSDLPARSPQARTGFWHLLELPFSESQQQERVAAMATTVRREPAAAGTSPCAS